MLYGLLSKGLPFNPATDIPDLSSKVIFITGGNTGLGKESLIQLSKHNPKHIYVAARTVATANKAVEEVRGLFKGDGDEGKGKGCPEITVIECDLGDLESVREAAKSFVGREGRLDLLVLNAGIMFAAAGVTTQGYEIHFGTNHVGHALLTRLLLPTMLRTAGEANSDVRVVSISSMGHFAAPPLSGIRFSDLKTPMTNYTTPTTTRYGQSKLANILFAKELARKYPSITSVALHPGVINTDLYRTAQTWFGIGRLIGLTKRMVMSTVEEGARNQLWAATAEGVVSGEYYMPVGLGGQESRAARDVELAKKLWEWTEREIEGYTL